MKKTVISLFSNNTPLKTPPIWLMRQAGRYLPEYRETRAKAGSFLELCYNSELAEEVTLQPIRRYNFDASIVFADILLIPQALGQKLWFEDGEGPRLKPISNIEDLTNNNLHSHLAPIYETLSRLSKSLPEETTLIGFAGAPWTVASYMIAGRGTPDQAPARDLMVRDRQKFSEIINYIANATCDYLEKQVRSGAEVLQIFESWASSLTGKDFEEFCILPVQHIVKTLRKRGINVPIIGFPRATDYDLPTYVRETGINGLSVDQYCNLTKLADTLDEKIVIQGNLAPEILVAGGSKMFNDIDRIRRALAGRKHIFNLGHGIVPQTPPQHVSDMVNYIRKGSE